MTPLLQRNRGSRLMPDGKLCSKSGCNQPGGLQGPNHSVRLGEPFWRLHCSHGHSTYWWRRKEELEPMPAEAQEKLHSRSNRFAFSIPRCERQGCPRFDKKMDVNVHPHPLKGGGSCKIAHFRCRGPESHVLYLSMPNGIPVTKDGWGSYHWTDNGKRFDTTPGRAADGTTPNWRPADWWARPGDYRVIATELMAKDSISNRELGKRLDAIHLIKCPYGESWEEALSGPGRAANRVSEVRKWMKRPGKTAA